MQAPERDLSPGLLRAVECLARHIQVQRMLAGNAFAEHTISLLKLIRDELADQLAAAEVREHGERRLEARERAGSQYGEAP